jgi:predicted DNA-binding transcriptional regulator YafY
MRASRLLSLLLLLQTRGRMTATELSERLEVSVRTVYRDIEALSSAGIPVYAERGPAGGYRLLEGYRTRLNGLTEQEASSLFLAALPGPAAELGLGEVAAAAELKLLAALPPEPRGQARRMRERFHLDVPGWYHPGDETRFLAETADAVWQQRPLRMTYRRWGPSVVERTVHPHGLVLKAGNWYMVARAVPDRPQTDGGPATPPADDMRTYRVGRIQAADLLDGYFTRADGFDLAAYWAEWSARFRGNMYQAEAVVRLDPDAVPMLRHTIGAAITDEALAEAGPPDDTGRIQVRVAIESTRVAAWQLLRLGAAVEVLEPAELRALMVDSVAELAKLYRLPA